MNNKETSSLLGKYKRMIYYFKSPHAKSLVFMSLIYEPQDEFLKKIAINEVAKRIQKAGLTRKEYVKSEEVFCI